MNILQQYLHTLRLITIATMGLTLFACSAEPNAVSDNTDNLQTGEATVDASSVLPVSDPVVNQSTEFAFSADEAGGNEQRRGGRNNTRSPQGIPDDATNRRNNARERRNNSGGVRGILIDNREVQSLDGRGNNQQFVEWGSTFSQLQRIGQANYSDDVSSMVYTDKAGPREISNALISQAPAQRIDNVYGTSDFTWQWGQFIDHDIDLTDGSSEEPQPIPVPQGDPIFDPQGLGTVTIPFNRAIYDPDTGYDSNNVRQQENEISSWIDGSMVYGNTEERLEALRVGADSPLLKTSDNDMLPFNTNSLTNANGPIADPTSLFLAGDVRANEQVGLASMHTLFVREHNRIARQLMSEQPDASAESVFQTARRLVVAEIQKITYDEFIPALLGPGAIAPYNGYNDSVNPTIYNEFSAAAFRLGHSMVSEQLLRLDALGNPVEAGHLNLEQAFFNAPNLLQQDDDLESILRGLAAQTHQAVDVRVIHPLRNLLFGRPGAGGLDLTALNIQRGRDHGLPSYTDMRLAMGLSPVSDFSGLTDDIDMQQSLQNAYGDVSKVDLWVGGLAESPLVDQGSQLGELFHAILVKQFTELRDGDRFWYENVLSSNELDFIDRVTLADIIRRNTNIGNELQDNVFYVR